MLVVLSPLTLATGCAKVGGEVTFAVCGQTLYTSPNMPVVQDVSSGPGQIHVHGVLLLRFTRDCTNGVDVTVDPATGAQVVARAKADDGRTAGLVLSPKVQHLRLRVHRPDGAAYDVEVTEDALPTTAALPSA